MNLADELGLCSIDANGYAFSPKVIPALGAALVTELVLAERLRVDGDAVAVGDPEPTGDELADELLAGLDTAGGQGWSRPGRGASGGGLRGDRGGAAGDRRVDHGGAVLDPVRGMTMTASVGLRS